MEDLKIQNVNLEKSSNMEKHRTEGFSSSNVLVVRRGEPFRISAQLEGRRFNPKTDSLRVKVLLGRLYVTMPVTFSKKVSSTRWAAYMDPEELNLQSPSIFISCPASAPVGRYRFQLCVFTQNTQKNCAFGTFILLCNPWCRGEFKFKRFRLKRY